MAIGVPVIPSANTLEVQHEVESGKIAVLTQVIITNGGGSESKVWVAISAADAPTPAEYIVNGVVCPGVDVLTVPVGDELVEGTRIVVKSVTGTVSFRPCGKIKDA